VAVFYWLEPDYKYFFDVIIFHFYIFCAQVKMTENRNPDGLEQDDRGAQKKRWCITLFVAEPEHESDTQPIDPPVTRLTNGTLPKGVKYVVWQYERCPTTGRLHIQGYARFVNRVRYNTVKSTFGFNALHCKAAVGSEEENRGYCTKEERVAVGEELGQYDAEEGKQGRRSDLMKIASEIEGGASLNIVARAHPADWIRYGRGIRDYANTIAPQPPARRDLTIYYLHGPTGTGKTHRVLTTYPDCYTVPTDRSTGAWDGYNGQSVILFDEWIPEPYPAPMRPAGWPIAEMNKCLDPFRLTLQSRYQNKQALWTTVFITSNCPPAAAYIDYPLPDSRDAFRRRIQHRCFLVETKENEGGKTLEEIINGDPSF